jgi:hypothetical protein
MLASLHPSNEATVTVTVNAKPVGKFSLVQDDLATDGRRRPSVLMFCNDKIDGNAVLSPVLIDGITIADSDIY